MTGPRETGLPTPAVPERVAPASRKSKWAGPRVSALGTALVTAPFLIAVSKHPLFPAVL
jgi:hypothetical protein